MALEAAGVEFIRKMTPKGLVCGLSIGSTLKSPKERESEENCSATLIRAPLKEFSVMQKSNTRPSDLIVKRCHDRFESEAVRSY